MKTENPTDFQEIKVLLYVKDMGSNILCTKTAGRPGVWDF